MVQITVYKYNYFVLKFKEEESVDTTQLLLSSQTKSSPLLPTAIPTKPKAGTASLLPLLMSCLRVLSTDTLASFPLLTYC